MALRLKAKCKITAVPLSSRMALFRLGLTCVRVEISHSVPASHPAGRSPSRRRGGVPAAWPPSGQPELRGAVVGRLFHSINLMLERYLSFSLVVLSVNSPPGGPCGAVRRYGPAPARPVPQSAVMAAERERRFYRELPKVVSGSGRRLRARPREGQSPACTPGGGPGAGTGRRVLSHGLDEWSG